MRKRHSSSAISIAELAKKMDIITLCKHAGSGEGPDEKLYTDEAILRFSTDLSVQNDVGDTPLHIVARNGNALLAKTFVTIGNADINITNQLGQTPLHTAAMSGNEAILWLLLENGADPNQQDLEGNTPTHIAASTKEPTKLLELLLKKQANIELHNFKRETPYQLAKGRITPLLTESTIAIQIKDKQAVVMQRIRKLEEQHQQLTKKMKANLIALRRHNEEEREQLCDDIINIKHHLDEQRSKLEQLEKYSTHLKDFDAAMSRLQVQKQIKDNPTLFVYVNTYASILNGIYLTSLLSGRVDIQHDNLPGKASKTAEVASKAGEFIGIIGGITESIPVIGGTIAGGFKCVKAIFQHISAIMGREQLQRLLEITPPNPSEWHQIVEDVAIRIACYKEKELSNLREVLPQTSLKAMGKTAWEEIRRFISTDPKQSPIQRIAALDATNGIQAILEGKITRETLVDHLFHIACTQELQTANTPTVPALMTRKTASPTLLVAGDPREALARAFHETTDDKIAALATRVQALEFKLEHNEVATEQNNITFAERIRKLELKKSSPMQRRCSWHGSTSLTRTTSHIRASVTQQGIQSVIAL